MAEYHKVDCRIWLDKDFRRAGGKVQIETIEAIVFGYCKGKFQKYMGPVFRVADEGPRRPDLTTSEWRAARQHTIESQGTDCRYCGADCADDPTIDHIFPVSKGGAVLDPENLAVCCRPCNSSKGTKEVSEWLA